MRVRVILRVILRVRVRARERVEVGGGGASQMGRLTTARASRLTTAAVQTSQSERSSVLLACTGRPNPNLNPKPNPDPNPNPNPNQACSC